MVENGSGIVPALAVADMVMRNTEDQRPEITKLERFGAPERLRTTFNIVLRFNNSERFDFTMVTFII